MTAPTIALAHAPEGAGNATRMIAVGAALRDRGFDVTFAGGGPGTLFAELNGFDSVEPETVDFIARRDGGVIRALARTAPRAARRLRDFDRWLSRQDPSVLLTDDPFAVAAARRHRVPYFRLDHATLADFDAAVERIGFRCFNWYSMRTAEAFLYTTLLSVADTGRPDLHHVGPVAHVPSDPEPVDPFDVLVIPGTYSTGFDGFAERLREDGLDVRVVGGPDWDPVPAMYPHAAAADVVLCTGFSSIAEAAVAGTHCVVYPFIDCQQGIADRLERHDVTGVTVVRSFRAASEAVRSPGESPTAINGTPAVADALESFVSQ